MRYRVYEAAQRWQIQELVEVAMSEGWTCQGGICVDTVVAPRGGVSTMFYQAMVKSNG